MHRVWDIAVKVIVIYIAAQIVVEFVTPLLPAILTLLALFGIASYIYYRKRSW